MRQPFEQIKFTVNGSLLVHFTSLHRAERIVLHFQSHFFPLKSCSILPPPWLCTNGSLPLGISIRFFYVQVPCSFQSVGDGNLTNHGKQPKQLKWWNSWHSGYGMCIYTRLCSLLHDSMIYGLEIFWWLRCSCWNIPLSFAAYKSFSSSSCGILIYSCNDHLWSDFPLQPRLRKSKHRFSVFRESIVVML